MVISTWFTVVLAVTACSAPVPLAPQFSDDFTTDTLKQYAVRGQADWQKGGGTLTGLATVGRKVALNLAAEAVVTLRWPDGAIGRRRAEVGIGAGTSLRASVVLEARLGQMVLAYRHEGRLMAEA